MTRLEGSATVQRPRLWLFFPGLRGSMEPCNAWGGSAITAVFLKMGSRITLLAGHPFGCRHTAGPEAGLRDPEGVIHLALGAEDRRNREQAGGFLQIARALSNIKGVDLDVAVWHNNYLARKLWFKLTSWVQNGTSSSSYHAHTGRATYS